MALLYQKVEMKLNFSKEKTTVFKIAQQTIPPVTFKQLVSDVAESCGVNATMTKAVIEGLINRIGHSIELGHAVQIGEFGTLKPTFTSKTQKDADDLSLKDVRSIKLRYYPGQRFKDILKKMSITELDALKNVIEEESSNGSSDGGSNSSPDFSDPGDDVLDPLG